MRSKYVAGNWKMNMDRAGALQLAKELVTSLRGKKGRFMIAPPFVYLDIVHQVIVGSNIILGAQDVAATDNGAHTGAVSIAMLKDLGVQSVILGHSERRYEFYENNHLINKKVHQVLDAGLEVVLCVGELYSQRIVGVTEDVCELQIREGLKGVKESQLSNVTIAYEPIWAIGTGKTATPQEAEEVHAALRELISKIYSKDAADKIRILYGGSMNANNAEELMAQPDIDGGLIGGASLKSETFTPICDYSLKYEV